MKVLKWVNAYMKKGIKERVVVILFVILGVIILGITSYRVYNDFIKDDTPTETKELDRIDLFGYTLDDTDTDLYKKYFDELSKIVSAEDINYEEYASSLSKLFITDFYTLSNKVTATDIGGLEFIHTDLLDNFKLNAGSTIYKYVESNSDGTRTQKLPTVSEVIIESVTEGKYTYKDEEYDSYGVNASWSYAEDLGYQTSMKLTLIKEGTELYIISGK